MAQSTVKNRLSAVRQSRGIGAADLAERVGVSRQTIYAIEAGSYVPNTEVTLRLARELEVTVEELFSLPAKDEVGPESLQAEVLSVRSAGKGQAVQVCRIGERLVCVPVAASMYFLPEADGVIAKAGRLKGRAELAVFSTEDHFAKRLILAGCDPAIGLLARMVERVSGVEIVSAAASSRLALDWLARGNVHVAGTHLKDKATGEFNVPIVRREYPDEDFVVITFARWEEGFVVAEGNPKGVRGVADLARRGVKIVNREAGAGSRALLDSLLAQEGMSGFKIAGYARVADGHLAAAAAVRSGEADCCIATRSAAQALGLGFVPLQTERYDFVLRRASLELPAVQSFLDVLQKASLRRKLEVLAGYDTAETGVVLV
ncbi:MAG TPA: substrate-binding domain-containing protein [Bryobacteraceae bacterium]|nr:substrate-binding domain-containing protein [Bryobacteraceae bacterium]